jgi:hypothetical protein
MKGSFSISECLNILNNKTSFIDKMIRIMEGGSSSEKKNSEGVEKNVLPSRVGRSNHPS